MKRCALALLVLVVLAPRTVGAQPADLTKEFQAGVDAFRLGKFDEARVHLEKARDLDPKLPGPHRFLAAVAQAQSKWQDCIDGAAKALELNPQSGEAADTRKLHETCRVSAGRSPYRQDLGDSAAVAVTTNVPGATVKINGLTYGGTPLAPRPITAGSLDVEIDKPGWKPAKLTITAPAGIVTDVIVDLDSDPNAQTPGLDVDGQKPKVGYLILPANDNQQLVIDEQPTPYAERIELVPGTHVVEIRAAGHDPWRRRVRISGGQKTAVAIELVSTDVRVRTERTGFYIVGGGGALLLGGFIAAMLSRAGANEARDIVRFEKARDPSRPLSETDDLAPVRTRADLADARDRASTFALISNITYAAGLATVGVGAYFLYKGARQRTDIEPPFAVSPVTGGAVVSKAVTW